MFIKVIVLTGGVFVLRLGLDVALGVACFLYFGRLGHCGEFSGPAWGVQMVVIVVLAKVPVNCSREGVILQMALGVINVTKEPAAICGFTWDGCSCYQRNQGAGCNLRFYSGWP